MSTIPLAEPLIPPSLAPALLPPLTPMAVMMSVSIRRRIQRQRTARAAERARHKPVFLMGVVQGGHFAGALDLLEPFGGGGFRVFKGVAFITLWRGWVSRVMGRGEGN